MFNESQVSNDRRENVADETNSGRRFKDNCPYCRKRVRGSQEELKEHEELCIKRFFKPEELGISYVICKICNFHAKSLGKHVSGVHQIRPADYIKQHGQIKCSNTRENYSNQNKKNGDWITRANQAGKDLAEYKQKMAAAVSESIMSDPEERQRRSELLGKLNKTDEFRDKSSKTAIKTSARPEILLRRTAQLKQWRDTHFEEFYEKCFKVMLSTWRSKPELALFDYVKCFDGYDFKNNHFIKSTTFIKKSKRKQIDIADPKMRVYLEYDGPYHFKNINGMLEENQLSDKLLDEHIIKHGWTLIRIGMDQWNGKKFTDDCLKQIFELLKQPKPGVFKIGKVYETI